MKLRIKSHFIMFIGLLLIALEITYIMIPNNLVTGGIGGLAIIIHANLPQVPVGLIMTTLNIILFVIGFIFIGFEFGTKTIVSSLLLSGMVWFLQTFHPIQKPLSDDILLQLILAMCMAAIGIALIFQQNGSTGGTDIIAKILNKYFHLDMGKAVLTSDLLIVLASIFTFNIEIAMYGLLGLFLNGLLIDFVLQNLNTVKDVIIISQHSRQIMTFIDSEFGESATVYKAFDAKTNHEREVIRIVLIRKDFLKLKKYIQLIDPKAYITANPINETIGFRFVVSN